MDLSEINIHYDVNKSEWIGIIQKLASQISNSAVGIYIHVSRGADSKRFHAYPENISPTVFAYAFAIADSQTANAQTAKTYSVVTAEDLRWQRCHIKSTSLLGNVMHFQYGQNAGTDEVILHDKNGLLTEAAACNIFIVKDGLVKTPILDNHILPGITRDILIRSLKLEAGIEVSQQNIYLDELTNCDEVWITSSSKEVGAVSSVNGRILNHGKAGPMWETAQDAYNKCKYDL